MTRANPSGSESRARLSAMLLSVPTTLLCMCERVSVILTYSTTAVSRLLV